MAKAPSPRVLLALALVALAGLYLWLRGGSGKAVDKPKAAKAASMLQTRARRDFDGLGKALSNMATRTIGTALVTGRVEVAHEGRGIAEAEVIFTGPMGEASTLSDAEGNFSIELPPGLYRSYARHAKYVAVAAQTPERLPGPVSAAAIAMPREGIAPLQAIFRDRVIRIEMSAAVRLHGRVLDEAGRGIAGAIVTNQVTDLRVISGSDVTESESDGHYELLVAAGPVAPTASHDDYAGVSHQVYRSAQAGDDIERDLVLIAGCIIEGNVVDSEGELVDDGSFERDLGGGVYAPIGEIKAGRVRFATTTAGDVSLRAWPWKSPPSEPQRYACTADSHYRDEVFVIPQSEASLTGYVEDDEGQRVAFAFVDLFSLEAGGATQQERADENGDFAFYALPEGAYQLSVYAPRRGAVLTLIDAPSSGIPLRLGGVGSVRGSVSDSHGELSFRYRCRFELGEDEAARSDSVSLPWQTLQVPIDRGRFRVDDLPACPLEGSVATSGGLHRSFFVEVLPRRDVELRIE